MVGLEPMRSEWHPPKLDEDEERGGLRPVPERRAEEVSWPRSFDELIASNELLVFDDQYGRGLLLS